MSTARPVVTAGEIARDLMASGRSYAEGLRLVARQNAAMLRSEARVIRDMVEHGSEPGCVVHAADELERLAKELEER